MNAHELVSAAFDEAQSEYSTVTAEYIQQYAAGALDMHVSDETAQKIVDAIKAYEDEEVILDDEAYDRLIKRPLSEIEL